MRPIRGPLAYLAALWLWPALAPAGPPDLPGAGRALVATPLQVAGDLIGAAGLVAASALASGGDAIALLDANVATRPVLRGAASRGVQTLAFALAWSASRALEGLRCEDIERLPEPLEAYVGVAPFAGRLDTALTGAASLWLGIRDAWSGPALATARAAGADHLADTLARGRLEARVRALGPEPLPAPSKR